ncbi:glutamine synthetase [Bacillus fungorum]
MSPLGPVLPVGPIGPPDGPVAPVGPVLPVGIVNVGVGEKVGPIRLGSNADPAKDSSELNWSPFDIIHLLLLTLY